MTALLRSISASIVSFTSSRLSARACGFASVTAAFTSATVVNTPTVDSSITNKQYVDSTALSLAIAFGL